MKTLIQNLIFKLYKIVKAQVRSKTNRNLVNRGLLKIGKYSYGVDPLLIDIYRGSESKLIIGNYSSISKGVRFITGGNHQKSWVSTSPLHIQFKLPEAYQNGLPYSNGDIKIGNDVWIGTNCTILSGVEICDGAIVYAGSLVTKSIPPYSLMAGVPAKLIGQRFDDKTIVELLKIKWWNWEDEKVISAAPILSSHDINSFINKFK
jgi:acetyltransferase-like isoleucine patch superfamily enzyme